jgi:hypothetical protein
MVFWDVVMCSLLDRDTNVLEEPAANYMAHTPEDVSLTFTAMRTSNPFLILKHLDFRPHKGLQISICICEERISSL